MRLLVDADSMPVRLREIIARQAERRGLRSVLFANRALPGPLGPTTEQRVVPDADDAMVADAHAGDLAVTHDVPLASRLVEKDVTVLDDRGGRFTAENIGERLSARDFAASLREADLMPASRGRSFGAREVQAFANALDRELTSLLGAAGKKGSVEARNPEGESRGEFANDEPLG